METVIFPGKSWEKGIQSLFPLFGSSLTLRNKKLPYKVGGPQFVYGLVRERTCPAMPGIVVLLSLQ